MTQAQQFVDQVKAADIAPTRGDIEAAGGKRTGRFEENEFFAMPDGSRLALSDPSGGHRLVRAMPAL